MDKMDKKLLGKWGEEQAANYLRKKKYEIISAGYRTRFGEIDIIAKKKNLVVFVEVKLRKNDNFALAMEYVDVYKQNRLRTTAEIWLGQKQIDCPCRFDVIEVYAPYGADGKISINHIENAF